MRNIAIDISVGNIMHVPVMHVPVVVPWFGDLLEMAAKKGMDAALLGQLRR